MRRATITRRLRGRGAEDRCASPCRSAGIARALDTLVNRPLALLLPAATLSVALLITPTLLACEPIPCDPRAPVYARDVTPVMLTQNVTQRITIVLTAPTQPRGATLIDFGLLHCAAAPITSGTDDRANGTFRLLDAAGAPLAAAARATTTNTINGWCLAEHDARADALPSIPSTAFDCTSHPCTASLLLEITPTVSIAADEIEVRLHDASASCSGTSAAGTTTQIEQFGP